VPILLIGEEHLDSKIKAWERLHSRVLEWVHAPPANLADAHLLCGVYALKLIFTDDLLIHLIDRTSGSVRRIKQNIQKALRAADNRAPAQVSLDWWMSQSLSVATGDVQRKSGAVA
jgi:hypothetical protein